MSGAILPFRPIRKRATGVPGSDVYIVEAQDGGFLVVDMSPSGGSAGTHGPYSTRAEAIREGRRIAQDIGGTFFDDDGGGAAA